MSKLLELLKRFDFWLGKLFFSKNFGGAAGFKGDLTMKVIRAKPTTANRFTDFLKGHK